MNLPEESNTTTGGAAMAACSGGRVRGRCRSHTLSCASIAKLEGSPSFHFSGTLGQAESTSKVGRLRPCGPCASATGPSSQASADAATRPRRTFDLTFALCPLTFDFDMALPHDVWEHTLEDASVPHYSFADIVVDTDARRVTRAGQILS